MNKNTKKGLKTFFLAIGIVLYCYAMLITGFILLDKAGFHPDYCIEDGDCEEGRILKDWNGKTIVITKEYCLENNYEWHEENKFCKTSYNEPWKVDACLDKGGCWDYIRHRCEMKDQGYCARNEKDCTNRNGTWQEDKKYCKLEDQPL